TNRARILILSRVVGAEAVNAVTFCLISAEASRRPLVRLRYQIPISCQLEYPFVAGPPGGKKEITICPCKPLIGGMSSSSWISFRSFSTHCPWLMPDSVGFDAGELCLTRCM